MANLTMSREIAHAASLDAGNRSMRRAGRTAWSKDDYNAAVDEYNCLWPLETELAELQKQAER